MKFHFKRVVGNTKLTFEELTTVPTQIESCLTSRPLISLSGQEDDGIEVLTPSHFLIGQSIESIPDPSLSYHSLTLQSTGIYKRPISKLVILLPQNSNLIIS